MMARDISPLAVDTLGAMKRHHCGLSVHCKTYDCRRRRDIDLDALIVRLGEDHGCMHWDLIKVFYCPACRAAGRPDRNISFIQHSDTRSQIAKEGSTAATLAPAQPET
jgi:hypothetical protein